MSIVSDKEWFELPYSIAAAKLVEFRTQLRQNNLHDTEEPTLRRATLPRRARRMPREPTMARATICVVRVWGAPACDSGATCR